MFSKLTLEDINSIGTYYYSLVSYMINLIKKYTYLKGNILMQNKNWSMQGSCTDGKIYMFYYGIKKMEIQYLKISHLF